MHPQIVTDLIKSRLKDAKVQIVDLTGGGDHLGITVISDCFKEKALLEQHKMVMDILKEKLETDLHAVQLSTLTYEKAKNKGLL